MIGTSRLYSMVSQAAYETASNDINKVCLKHSFDKNRIKQLESSYEFLVNILKRSTISFLMTKVLSGQIRDSTKVMTTNIIE